MPLDSGCQASPASAGTRLEGSAADGVDGRAQEDKQEEADPVILGSFRRSSSERLRHGAKSLLRRMESLRSRSRRRPALVRPPDGALVIGAPRLLDACGMEERVRELHCVDLTPPESASPASSTPSPDLGRAKSDPPEASSPAASVKTVRGFFARRSFRPSGSSSARREKDAHSDSECAPGGWSAGASRRSASKQPREVLDPESPPTRGKLRLSLVRSLKTPGSALASPEDEELRGVATPSGSLQLSQLDAASTGSHADSDCSPAATGRYAMGGA